LISEITGNSIVKIPLENFGLKLEKSTLLLKLQLIEALRLEMPFIKYFLFLILFASYVIGFISIVKVLPGIALTEIYFFVKPAKAISIIVDLLFLVFSSIILYILTGYGNTFFSIGLLNMLEFN